MIIDRKTKISKILRENSEAIAAIASINKHFEKLNNPVLRRVLAPRVRVEDAAKIGKISVNDFLKRLEKIGFEVQYETDPQDKKSSNVEKPSIEIAKIVSLDVRPTINSGADPFSEIMGTLKEMKDDETLKLINIFEPIPIIQILQEKGYTTWVEKISDNEYHSFFTKNTKSSHIEIINKMPISEGSFEEKLVSFGGNVKEIDVRHLEMPEPMVTILNELENLPENFVLLVNHKKVPQFLLPELKSRNFFWMHKDMEPGLTLLLIYKEQ